MTAAPRLLLVVALALTVAAAVAASRLTVETDLTRLLPPSAPAATDYRVFAERFGAFERVFVVLEWHAGEIDGPGLVGVAEGLAAELRRRPEVARARAGIERSDLEFLTRVTAPQAALLVDGDWRRQIAERLTPEAIERRVSLLRARALGPLSSFDLAIAAGDPLGLGEGLPALSPSVDGLPIEPLTGGFLADDRYALIVVTPAGGVTDPEAGRALAAALDDAFATVSKAAPRPLVMHAAGGSLYAAEDEKLVTRDLRTSLTLSTVGCLLLLIVAFRSLRLPLAALATVVAGMIWTAGALALGAGSVTAAGLGFTAVLIGLGLDYSIHLTARFRQALAASAGDPGAALRTTVRRTGAGLIASAVTTAGAFAVLASAQFRPLREVGWLVAAGIVCVLLATVTVGLPLLLWAARSAEKPGSESGGRLWAGLGRTVDRVSATARRRAPLVATALALLTIGAGLGIRNLTLDPSLQVFRSLDHAAAPVERLLFEQFDVGADTATVVVEGDDLSTALGHARAVRRAVEVGMGDDGRVVSPSDYLAADRLAERRETLRQLPLGIAISEFEQAALRHGLDPAFFGSGLAALAALAEGQPPPAGVDRPDWLEDLVRDGDERVSLAVQLRRAGDDGEWLDGPPPALTAAVVAAAPGSHLASMPRVGAEIRQLAGADFARLGTLAAVVVTILVLISFRGRLWPTGLGLLPVALGTFWSLGLWGAIGRPLDLVSLAVIPIVLGVGIDDGLHALHAWQADRTAGIVGALRESGRALLLTTLTTGVAFASLTTTSIPGLQRAGALVALGVVACLAATLLALPAVEALVGGGGERT